MGRFDRLLVYGALSTTIAIIPTIINAQAPGGSPAAAPKYSPDVPAKITTPDTVQTRIGTLRFRDGAPEAAGDLAHCPDAGPPWRSAKLYYTAVARSAIKNLRRAMSEAGIETPFGDGPEPEIGIADELITTQVDVSAQVERKRQALMAHATQMGQEVFFAKMPPALFHRIFARESFQLVRGGSGAPGMEDDLFAGLRG